jgi:hypothetical protein
MSDSGNDLARLGYYFFIPLMIVWGFIASQGPDRRNRVCEGREGLQVAVSVPAGKGRFRRNVKTSDGDLIPYGEWVSSCKAVYLPGEEEE